MRYYGDPVLRRKAKPVDVITDDLRALAADMTATMRDAGGIGLAANQVGDLRRIVLVDVSAGKTPAAFRIVVNPRIVRRTGSHTDEEGCLSLPGLRAPVRRAMEARIEGLGLDGQPVAIEAAGLEARAFQHEIDHLDGILFTDRLPFIKRIRMWKELGKIKRRYGSERNRSEQIPAGSGRSGSSGAGPA